MIVYNGATGSLGQYFGAALAASGVAGCRLRARLEDRASLATELDGQSIIDGASVCLVQMAARVSVPACESDPKGARKTNVTDATATVAEFVRWATARRLSPRVVYVSSGHVYAPKPVGTTVSEDDDLAPRSEYARTKLDAERALTEHARANGYPLVVARVFGLVAPRQPSNYVLQGLIRRVNGGDLSGIPGLGFTRDYLDARDVCRILVGLCAPELAAQSGTTILNVCSGVPVKLRDIVTSLLGILRPDQASALESSLGEAPGRPDDVPWIVGSPLRLESRVQQRALQIPLATTLREAAAAAAASQELRA